MLMWVTIVTDILLDAVKIIDAVKEQETNWRCGVGREVGIKKVDIGLHYGTCRIYQFWSCIQEAGDVLALKSVSCEYLYGSAILSYWSAPLKFATSRCNTN